MTDLPLENTKEDILMNVILKTLLDPTDCNYRDKTLLFLKYYLLCFPQRKKVYMFGHDLSNVLAFNLFIRIV